MEHVIAIMAMATLVVGYCPRNKIHTTGNCSFRIHCHEDVRGIGLPPYCRESTNERVTVDLTLTNAVEHFGTQIDQEFLSTITTLRIYADWRQTDLASLENTTSLENLLLSNNRIEVINGEPFYLLNSLSFVDLSYNRLTQVDHLFKFILQPNKFRMLYLSHNRIKMVAADAFSELTSLIELDLSYNFISDLTAEPFSNLTSLEVLRLNNNNIINLNGAVNNLHSLRHLYLRGNQIDNIDEESLKIINHLETFDVSSNHLDAISSIMFLRHWEHLNSRTVFKIILSGNSFSSIPNTTAREVSVKIKRHLLSDRIYSEVFTELDLSDNDISNIEFNAFQSLTRLTTLNLSHNKLIDFYINAHDLAYIKCLNLSGNYISRLYPESFSQMKNLERLDLSANRLEYIPSQTFHKNYNLRHLNMTFNAIEKLDDLNINMLHLNGGILDLSNNGISKLRIPYGDHSRLTYLILHSNNITDASLIDLQYQNDLMTLDLSRNQIPKLNEKSFLHLPASLNFLDLTCNNIESIEPSTFLHVWHLKTLMLSHNSLKTIEYGAFRGLTSLLHLDLSFNRIGMLDSKLMLDLKSLSVLNLEYNGIQIINDEGWYGHKSDLKVYLDGNNFTCDWLAAALKNHNNGYTKMKPTVLSGSMFGHSLEGIPCTPEGTELASLRVQNSVVLADERLLLTTQKLLEVVKEQTYYLKKYVWHTIQDDANKVKEFV